MYDANKQSKNGIVVSYKHIVPENKIIKIGIRKNDRKLYSMLFLTLAKQFKNKVIAPVDNAKIPKIDQAPDRHLILDSVPSWFTLKAPDKGWKTLPTQKQLRIMMKDSLN